MAAPFPVTCAGAASATGRMTTGMRTSKSPPDQVSWPPAYALRVASVRVNVTVKDFVWPAASDRVDGLTTALTPVSPATDALTVNAPPLTFVTLRVTVWTPARSPIAIDGTLRLLGSIPSV